MDRKTITIIALSMLAGMLLMLNIDAQRTAEGNVVVVGRDYQAVTTPSKQGGDALYILDNKTGQMAVFMYDTRDRMVRARDVRMVRDAFAGR